MDTQVNPTPLPAGTVLEGYTVEQALESEPNVLRYSARNAAGDRVVLVELFPPETVIRDGVRVALRSADDQEGWQAWIRSFSERTRQLATLNHPGLVKLRHSFIANGTAYCVIEPIGGETLSSVLERDGTLPEPRLRQLLFSLITALQEAHNAGLLHGDIEPSRIRLQFDGKAILSGFATLVTPIRFKGHTTVNSGTPGYAPPEHLLVQAAEQPSSDIYSLAAIAYRAICGEAPPEARMRGAGAELKPSAQLARGRYSAALTSAIDAALAMRAQQRPQTLAQWRQMLESEEAVAPSGPVRPAPAKKSSPVVWIAAPALLVVLGVGYFLFQNGKSKAPAPPPVPAPSVAAAPAEAASPATLNSEPSSAATLPTPTLDQLAISMLKRGQRPVHSAPPEPAVNAPKPVAAAGAAIPAGAPAAKSGQAAATPAPAQAGPAQTAAPPGAVAPTAVPAAAPVANPPAAAGPSEAEKQKEQEALQKAAQEETARQAQKDAAAKQAAANEARDRIKKIIARAKAKCEIPAPELSESENLVYENALNVPGSIKQADGTIRLPVVTLSDGTTALFSIDQQSCAHRIR